ncbi:Cell division SepF [Gossypium arboreum]|uniref:Cell division SepF n=1 Tax=Gossypium arboreum TaxID=29729 RepID=A0A0B0PGC9_GOSAR|nr:Cell division SepF [Gossypium arboreum]
MESRYSRSNLRIFSHRSRSKMIWHPCVYREQIEDISDLTFLCLQRSRSKTLTWHPCVYREQETDRRHSRSDIPVLTAKQIENFSMASLEQIEKVNLASMCSMES